MYCINCGKKLAEDERFCENCGKETGIMRSPEPEEKTPSPEPVILTGAVKAPDLPDTASELKEAFAEEKAHKPAPDVANSAEPLVLSDTPYQKPKKKKGCLIAVVIFSVTAFLTILFLIVSSLLAVSMTNKSQKDNEEPETFQEVDYSELIEPANLRGDGMEGYWVGRAFLDGTGQEIDADGELALFWFGPNGKCIMRAITDDMIDDAEGTYDAQNVNITDSATLEPISFAVQMDAGEMRLDMGEEYENLTFLLEGPYDEETLVYQNLEYLKAASFMTSAMLEGQEQSDLEYDKWYGGLTDAISYWDSLSRASDALDFAVYVDSCNDAVAAKGEGFVMPELNFDFGVTAYAASSYDVEEVKGVIDRAGSRNRIRMLSRHLNVTAKKAMNVLVEVQDGIIKEAYKDEKFYGNCEKYARRIKAGSKVTLLICGTVASGGTLAAGEGVVFIIQGADVAMEVTENEAYISYEIEGKRSSKKALEGLNNIRKWTAPAASIVGIKGLDGDGFEKFMELSDAIFDAQDGKICSIKVVNSMTGEVEVAQVTKEQFESWKEDNRSQGYKLTEDDKKDIWKEIFERAEREKAEEAALQAAAEAQKTPEPETPTQAATTVLTAAPTQAPTATATEAPAGSISKSDFVGTWVINAIAYYNEGSGYEDTRGQELYEAHLHVYYEFKSNMTMDVYLYGEGNTTYMFTDRKYWIEDGVVYIEDVHKGNEETLIYSYQTRCRIIGDELFMDFDCPNPVKYVCDKVE